MQIDTKHHETGTVVHVSGRMGAESADEFETACRHLIQEGVRRIVLDLGELRYIGSMGLRALVSIAKAVNERGGILILCRPSGAVREILQMTRFDSMFPMYESEQDALNHA